MKMLDQREVSSVLTGRIRAPELHDQRSAEKLDLIRRVQSRDQRAFRELVERHQAKVFSIIYRILHHREDTEDIAQQVFTKVYFAIPGFDRRCSLLAWICRIAINECYSHLRRRKVKLIHETSAIDTAMAQRDFLNKLLSHIPEEERLLLILKEVGGHSIGELAEMTGLEASVIKGKLFRARQRLIQAANRFSWRPGFGPARQ